MFIGGMEKKKIPKKIRTKLNDAETDKIRFTQEKDSLNRKYESRVEGFVWRVGVENLSYDRPTLREGTTRQTPTTRRQ